MFSLSVCGFHWLKNAYGYEYMFSPLVLTVHLLPLDLFFIGNRVLVDAFIVGVFVPSISLRDEVSSFSKIFWKLKTNFLPISVQFSCSVVSDSLRPHGLQHARLLSLDCLRVCGEEQKLRTPSPTLTVHSWSCGTTCLKGSEERAGDT